MKLYRIKAVILRHLLLSVRVFGNVINLFYWPFINILIWGFNSIWNQNAQQQFSEVTFTLLVALTLWQVLFRINMEVCMNLYDEILSNDFTSLFSTPLKLYEWMIAVIVLGFIKSFITLLFVSGCIWILYSVNVLSLGLQLIPFIILITITGWSVGFLTASGLVYWGKSVHELVWVVVWAFVPISGIFYSIKVLPIWAQNIAWFIPQSHIFETIRNVIASGELHLLPLLNCLMISTFYFALSLLFFKFSFERSRVQGLSRLER